MGMKAEDYLHDKVEIDDKLSGVHVGDSALRDKFIDRDELSVDELFDSLKAK